jgi:hypothetical protein
MIRFSAKLIPPSIYKACQKSMPNVKESTQTPEFKELLFKQNSRMNEL